MPKRPKRGSGERSNGYSGSKLTNWTPFDPYWSEAKGAKERGRPHRMAIPGRLEPLLIVSLETHPEFVRPCSTADVEATLLQVPSEYLEDLERVVLLSGTSKQARASRLFRYGCYSQGRIFLHAYPRTHMKVKYGAELKPSDAREYERAGAIVEKEDGSTVVTFDSSSLRRFYLYDVLLHEIGHHVDLNLSSRPGIDAERFAHWFAEAQARLIDAAR